MATPSGTAARGQNPRAEGAAGYGKNRPRRGSPSPAPAGMGRPPVRHLAAADPRRGPDLTVTLDSISTGPCEHCFEAKGHDPRSSCGTCPRSGTRRDTPAQPSHNLCRLDAYWNDPLNRHDKPPARLELAAGTVLTTSINTGPKCRHDHRLEQQAGWKVEQLAGGAFRWTSPAGRSYGTEPTRHPI